MWERSWTGQILTQLDTHTLLPLSIEDSHVSRQWGDDQTDRNLRVCVWLEENPDKQEVRPGQIWGLLNSIYWRETSWLFQFHFYICHSFVSLSLQPRGQDHLRVWRRPLVTEELTPQEKRLTKRSAGSQMCHLITEEGQERETGLEKRNIPKGGVGKGRGVGKEREVIMRDMLK